VRTSNHYVAGLRSRVSSTVLATRELDPVIAVLHACLSRTLDDGATLRAAVPKAFPLDALLDAYADVAHRSLFGLRPAVNVHQHRLPRPPKLPFRDELRAALEPVDSSSGAAPDGAARTALVRAAREVFAARGFHGTRVVDVVAAAGVSHGAFYRYFTGKDEIARLLSTQAIRDVSTTLSEIPDIARDSTTGRAALKRWLRTYTRAQASETAMIRVRIDAARQDDTMITDSASLLDWGRRRMARFLGARAFGDADLDAVVLLALVDALGAREQPAPMLDAAVHVIERGFLGL
jgi:AcrR family transcriptional regulator